MKMNKKGFTIVELVIVIAVIAILAGVLIPTFSGLVGKAQDSAVIQEARNKYTEYVGMHDYSDGTSPAQNIVIELGDGADVKYVTVIGGKLVDKVYKSTELEAAKTAAKYTNVAEGQSDAAYFLCDKHDWTDADGECKDCDAKCPTTHVTGTNACPTCGKANSAT